MGNQYSNEPMLEMYLFETSQLLEQLEQAIITSEKAGGFSSDSINEIFRFMHTIKGSSAMMLFNEIGTLAHSIEDVFYYLREKGTEGLDYSTLSDLVLEGIDFIKIELQKIKAGDEADGNSDSLKVAIKAFLAALKGDGPHAEPTKPESAASKAKQQYYIQSDKKPDIGALTKYKAVIHFKDGCEMENIRAYTIVHNLIEIAEDIHFIPDDIAENDEASKLIIENGFQIFFKTQKDMETLNSFFLKTIFLKEHFLEEVIDEETYQSAKQVTPQTMESTVIKVPKFESKEIKEVKESGANVPQGQSIISVNVDKLDKLMDLVGEMVIAEAMVSQNPEVVDLDIESFQKASRQLHKITTELQDMVMAIRMVPLSTTFMKMHRIMRDMTKKLGKEVELVVLGEETEVDKNIIERISDPLMHLIRNSLDHGIEDAKTRTEKGKNPVGTLTLEARNSGSDVLVIIKDDGRGLNKEKIYQKAIGSGLINQPMNEMTDQDIFKLILLPGFSTKEAITEFSGRGVGMDVVVKNLEVIGGTVIVDSIPEVGTTMTLKIPLTLAIIDGMNIRVGNARYTIPIIAIQESFRPDPKSILTDTSGSEMIMVRGQCYPILRLHEFYKVDTRITDFQEGILIMVEENGSSCCLFADELLGQQQVVVKALPSYIKKFKKIEGIGGCTLLGDGSISLILDIGGLGALGSKNNGTLEEKEKKHG